MLAATQRLLLSLIMNVL
jgi:hypothetical protein